MRIMGEDTGDEDDQDETMDMMMMTVKIARAMVMVNTMRNWNKDVNCVI